MIFCHAMSRAIKKPERLEYIYRRRLELKMTPKSQWTKDYMDDLLVQLPDGPFNQKASKKLWDHAAQVVQYVYSGSKFRNKL